MNGIAGASLSTLALWATLALTGVLAGTFLSRWKAAGTSSRVEGLLLAAAAAGVVAWFAQAGSLIGSSAASDLLTAYVPIEVTTGLRLTVLWATLPGGALTFAVTMLVAMALGVRPADGNRHRYLTVLSVAAFVALGLAAWFAPSPNAVAGTIPPFVQSPAAALAPLFALPCLMGLTTVVASMASGAPPSRHTLVGSWTAITLSVAAEQVARSELGIGPRDALVLGAASSGLVLWLLTSALLHRRVFRWNSGGERGRTAANAAHAGAAMFIISFALHAMAARSTVSVGPGAWAEVTDAFRRRWQLANQGVSRFDAEGADVLTVSIEATDPAGRTRLLTPEIHDHHGREGRHLENSVSLRKSAGDPLQTVRVVLLEADSLDVASVRVTFLPVPILWPLGIALLLLSAILASLGERRDSSV
jgi:hypothetical protein